MYLYVLCKAQPFAQVCQTPLLSPTFPQTKQTRWNLFQACFLPYLLLNSNPPSPNIHQKNKNKPLQTSYYSQAGPNTLHTHHLGFFNFILGKYHVLRFLPPNRTVRTTSHHIAAWKR